MARCEHVSFWVAGMKVRSGEATAHLPQGELKVVCRKAKAGEINVQELPDGTLLEVPAVGYFAFDSSRWRGRKGRGVPAQEVLDRLQGRTKAAYLTRVAATRKDLASATTILKAGSTWTLPSRPTLLAMIRRNPSLAGPIIDMGCSTPEMNYLVATLVDGINDPVLLHHAMNFQTPDPHMTTLAERAAERLSKLGFHRDAAAWTLSKLANSSERSHPYSYFPIVHSFPDHYIGEFASGLLDLPSVSPSFIDMLGDAIYVPDPKRTVARAEAVKAAVIAMRPRAWLEEDQNTIPRCIKRCDTAIYPMLRAEASASINWEALSDENLITTYLQERKEPFFDERRAAIEIAKRPLPNNPAMSDSSVFWATAMRKTGLFTDEQLITEIYSSTARSKALLHFNERQLRRCLEVGQTSAPVLVEALRLLDDIEVWDRFTTNPQEQHLGRYLAEHAPLEVLAELATRNTGMTPGALAIWEIAAGKKALDPLVTAKHHSPVVRRITARRAMSREVSELLLSDEDPSVKSAATRHCRDVKLLQRLVDEGITEVDERGRSIHDAFMRRIKQLEHYELARATAQSETLVARAALPSIKDRTLLLELIEFPELAPFIATEVEKISFYPPRR